MPNIKSWRTSSISATNLQGHRKICDRQGWEEFTSPLSFPRSLFFFFLHQNTCREISDCTNSFITFSMYSLSQTGETDLCQVFMSPRARQAKREFCVTGPSFFWFSSQFEICEKIQFEQSTLFNSETSSRPPESKPDVLIRPKDNK